KFPSNTSIHFHRQPSTCSKPHHPVNSICEQLTFSGSLLTFLVPHPDCIALAPYGSSGTFYGLQKQLCLHPLFASIRCPKDAAKSTKQRGPWPNVSISCIFLRYSLRLNYHARWIYLEAGVVKIMKDVQTGVDMTTV